MFGVFCIAMGIFVLFFMKETKGRTLEDMDMVFGAVTAEERNQAVEQALNKGGVTTHHDEEAPVGEERETKS